MRAPLEPAVTTGPSRARRAAPLVAAGCALLAFGGACHTQAPRKTFAVVIRAETEDRVPIKGAEYSGLLLPEGTALALSPTESDGLSRTSVEAVEGAQLEIEVRCPEGHRASTPVLNLTLQSIVDVGAAGPLPVRASVECRRVYRLAAVVIRAGGAAGLPVLVDGRAVGRTDHMGLAHLMVQIGRNASFRVGLDTSARPELRPSSPTRTYLVHEREDVFVLDQPFQKKPKPKKRRARAPVPERIEARSG